MTASSGLIWEWVRRDNSVLVLNQGCASHLQLEETSALEM